MNKLLAQFYEQESIRKAVEEFMVDTLKEMAVDKTFDGEDVTGIKEARELIVKMFDRLDSMYGKIKVTETNSR
jgi:hypothetical protein